MKTLLVVLSLLSSLVFASNPTDIKTKYGTWVNVKIIDSTDTYYKILTSKGYRTVNLDAIVKIELSSFDTTIQSQFIESNLPDETKLIVNESAIKNISYEQPYLPLLAVSAVFIFEAYNKFENISDLEKRYPDQGNSEKTRNLVGGILYSVAAIAVTIFSFQKVKVTVTNNSVGLSYNF